MIYAGIDDTDVEDSRGTNQLAKALARGVSGRWRCGRIVRHQLLDDPRVPYTSKNGSASLLFEPLTAEATAENLFEVLREGMLSDFIPGSDPGLCVATVVPEAIVAFGRRCQSEVVDQPTARGLAEEGNVLLEGLGGTQDGVIGALAAVGLAATGDDGRVVYDARWPDDFGGWRESDELIGRGIVLREFATGTEIVRGRIDVGRKLRPNRRGGETVLFVEAIPNALGSFRAIKRA